MFGGRGDMFMCVVPWLGSHDNRGQKEVNMQPFIR